jgi:hypothetical protein
MQMCVPRRSKNFLLARILLYYILLASSEITCHLIITCRKGLHSVAQHNIFELALTPDDEYSSHSFGEIKLQTIEIYLNASTCKE